MVPLKYLSNFSRTLEMPLINWTIKRTIKRIFKEQLIGININQKYQQKDQINI